MPITKKTNEAGITTVLRCKICRSPYRAQIDKMILEEVAPKKICEWMSSVDPETGKVRVGGSVKTICSRHKLDHLKIRKNIILPQQEKSIELYQRKVEEEATIAAISNLARERLLDLLSSARSWFEVKDLARLAELELKEKSLKTEEDLAKIQVVKLILQAKHHANPNAQGGEIEALRGTISRIEEEIRELRGDAEKGGVVVADAGGHG